MSETAISGVKLGGDANGTSLAGYVTASYADLVGLFGAPNSEGDAYKVSTEWILTYNGHVVTLYDWKMTDLYDYGMPVAAFRALPSYEWHVGAHSKKVAEMFISDVESALDPMNWSRPATGAPDGVL